MKPSDVSLWVADGILSKTLERAIRATLPDSLQRRFSFAQIMRSIEHDTFVVGLVFDFVWGDERSGTRFRYEVHEAMDGPGRPIEPMLPPKSLIAEICLTL